MSNVQEPKLEFFIYRNYLVLIFAVTFAVGCASFATEDGEQAPFATLNSCDAFSRWLEPLRSRYPNRSVGSWTESDYRKRMSFLFTDEYFIPVFGTSFDQLSRPQAARIGKSLKQVNKNCRRNEFLVSLYPGSILSRPFNHKLPAGGFSREFLTEQVFAQRANTDQVAVSRVQQQLSQLGYEPGGADGIYGRKTSEAVSAYKSDQGISPLNGEITASLIALLDSDETANVAMNNTANPPTRVAERNKPVSTARADEARYPQRLQQSMAKCDQGDAYQCLVVSYNFENSYPDPIKAKEYHAKTCIAADKDPGTLTPFNISSSCFNAGMAIGGTRLSSAELQAEQERRDAIGNLISGSAVPLKRETIQEALDVALLESQGLSTGQAALKDCVRNDGCAVLGGIVRARWVLKDVTSCSLVQKDLALCQFEFSASSQSTLSPRGGLRNNLLSGMMAPVKSDGEGLLKLIDGSWRFIPR